MDKKHQTGQDDTANIDAVRAPFMGPDLNRLP
jgi:hypothetical protein